MLRRSSISSSARRRREFLLLRHRRVPEDGRAPPPLLGFFVIPRSATRRDVPRSDVGRDVARRVRRAAPRARRARQRAVRVHDPVGPDAGQPLERIDVLGVHPQEGLASVQVRQKIMRRRGLDGPGMERAREFEERTRVVAERLDVEEIFRTRETEFLFRGGGEGVVDCDCDCD